MSAFSSRRRRSRRAFTLIEMMMTLAIFILLAAAVFGLLTGVLQSTSSLQDNQNRRDEIAALNAFLKKKLGEMPAGSTLQSYRRGDGEGLDQNGIAFGTVNFATAIDGKAQANGYYILRIATLSTGAGEGAPQDARQLLLQEVTSDDATLSWTTLLGDIKTLHWKFQHADNTEWVDLWGSGENPNLIEFSMQLAAELQPNTMDFWLPKIEPIVVNIAPPPSSLTNAP